MILPLGNTVFILPDKLEEHTESGIILTANAAKERQACAGTVAFVGADVEDVQVGDRVLYAEYGMEETQISEKPGVKQTYMVGRADQILGIIE